MSLSSVNAILVQTLRTAKLYALKAHRPFFVNGKSLPSFGQRQLEDLVRSEVVALN